MNLRKDGYMQMNLKRFLATALVFAMMLTMMPIVRAVEGTQIPLSGLTVDGLMVSRGEYRRVERDTIVAGSGCIVTAYSGNKVSSTMKAASYGVYVVLTFANMLDQEATLSFTVAVEHEDSDPDFQGHYKVDGEKYTEGKAFEMKLGAKEAVEVELVSPDGYGLESYFDLEKIALIPAAAADISVKFEEVENGSYTVINNATNETMDIGSDYTVPAGTKFTLNAVADEDYQFFGWHDGKKYVSYKANDDITLSGNATIYPVFISATKAVFGVGSTKFEDLSEADAYATNSENKVIVLMNDGILTGEHTISAGNTLLIPYNDKNAVHTEATSTAIAQDDGKWTNVAWEKPYAFRKLTMVEGAELTILGSLNVGGRHSAGPWQTAGSPSGAVGMIQMAEGSNITVEEKGELYCWGYIYGDGTVTAESGATVHENIQFADFRGGNATAGIAMSFLVFPMSQYYVQNIEVATTYKYGAVENVWCSIYLGTNSMVYGTSIQFIGADENLAMFVPEEGSTVTKTYLPAEDRLQIDVDGKGSINPMTLAMDMIEEVMGGPLNTETFILPITNNMTININSGMTTVNQSLALLPGVQLNIANGATLFLAQAKGDPYFNEDIGFGYAGGNNLVIYDRDQWFNGFTLEGEPVDTYYVYSGKRLQPVAHSPSWDDDHYVRTEKDLLDAVVDINGTLLTEGFIYTTVGIEYNEETEEELPVGGASIISSNGTGKLVMQNGAGQDFVTFQATQSGSDPVFVMLMMLSARLQNADGSYFDTMGYEPGAEFAYCSVCGEWYAVEDQEGPACPSMSEHVEISWVIDGVNVPQEVRKGTSPVYAGDLNKVGYKFLGWKLGDNGQVLNTLPAVNGGEVFIACFELLGDLDPDGEITEDDVTLLARHVAGISELTDAEALAKADMDQDGDIDAKDLTLLAQRYVELCNSGKNT